MLKMLLRSLVGRFMPIITSVVDIRAPTISGDARVLPTVADHRHWVPCDQLGRSVHDRAATMIRVEPTGTSSNAIDAPTAAISFVRWAADHHLACELKVDDLWYLASQDFAPAHELALPPRRVFLGALKCLPGVKVVHDRRVYGRNGRAKAKTTFYTFPPRTAPSAIAIQTRMKLTGGGKTAVSESVAGDTISTIDPMTGEMHETRSTSSCMELIARPSTVSLGQLGKRHPGIQI
jgi:hypothetical protein